MRAWPNSKPNRISAMGRDYFVGLSTIGARIRAQSSVHADRLALVGIMFAPVSYKDLTRQIEDVRRRFRQAGLGRDARIAVGIANSATAAWSIVTTACSAAAIPLDPKLTAAEVERCFHSVRPSAVLLSEGSAVGRAQHRGTAGLTDYRVEADRPRTA